MSRPPWSISLSSEQRLRVYAPSLLLQPHERPPSPPPMPGTVERVGPVEDTANEPPKPVLRRWTGFARCSGRVMSSEADATSFALADRLYDPAQGGDANLSIPCDIDMHAVRENALDYNVRRTVQCVFKDRSPALVEAVLQSLESPFTSRGGASDDEIVWTLVRRVVRNEDNHSNFGGKKRQMRHRRLLKGPAWSIVTFADPAPRGGSMKRGCIVRRNMIYDDKGDAVAQIDFAHSFCGLHAHALVYGNLEHTPGSMPDHMFPLPSVPWFWTLIADTRPACPTTGVITTAASAADYAANEFDSESDDGGADECGRTAGEGENSRSSQFPLLPSLEEFDGCHWVNISVPMESFLPLNSDEL